MQKLKRIITHFHPLPDEMNSAFGTHMDAPAHFKPEGLTIEAIPVENLIVPLYVIDVT
ncbi:MAG: Kynurenine formamidase [Chlamydiae bacterium]|nr:Kynurenine formamidase [Chlamydiota bacterium]